MSIDRGEAIHEAAGIVAVDIDARSKRGAVHRATALEAKLDHLVYATPDLADTVARIRNAWGVNPTSGGSHDGLGTANALLAIGNGAYLEIIGPDPSQPNHVGPRPFGVDDVTEPRLITWAAAVPDLDLWLAWCTARKLDPGPAFAMQRTTPLGTSFTGVSPFLPVMATASCPSSSSGPAPRRPRQLQRESNSLVSSSLTPTLPSPGGCRSTHSRTPSPGRPHPSERCS